MLPFLNINIYILHQSKKHDKPETVNVPYTEENKKRLPDVQSGSQCLGERIRTSGLLNPIQARYQTAPHPDNSTLPYTRRCFRQRRILYHVNRMMSILFHQMKVKKKEEKRENSDLKCRGSRSVIPRFQSIDLRAQFVNLSLNIG